jgi:flagellar biosynthesis/type III secretory pathway M-ring protein FliF/YscJ
MALGNSTAAATGGLLRPLAMLACALALGLLCWRGAALLTGPGAPISASSAEAALADVLAPVAGPGLSRLSVTFNAEGGRTVLLLVDDRAAGRLPELQRIAPIAAGLIPERGDKLVIETVAFAEGLPGRPDTTAWAELAVLGALVLIAGALAFLSGRTPPQPVPVAQAVLAGKPAPVSQPVTPILPAPQPAERPREAPRAVRPVSVVPPADGAVDIARRDPARAAAVVRGWMSSRDENT